jgi:hypothetical protein
MKNPMAIPDIVVMGIALRLVLSPTKMEISVSLKIL